MAVRVTCPKCQTAYSLPDAVRGKQSKVNCKKCGASFVVGAASARTPSRREVEEPEPPRSSSLLLVFILLLLSLVAVGGGAATTWFLLNQAQPGPVALNGTPRESNPPTTPETTEPEPEKPAPTKPEEQKPPATKQEEKPPTTKQEEKPPSTKKEEKPPMPDPEPVPANELEAWKLRLGKAPDAFVVAYHDICKTHLGRNSAATYTVKRSGEKEGIVFPAPPPEDGMKFLEEKAKQIKIDDAAKFKEFEVVAGSGKNCDVRQARRLWSEAVARVQPAPPMSKFYDHALVLKALGDDQFLIKVKEEEIRVTPGSGAKYLHKNMPITATDALKPGNLVGMKTEKRQGMDVETLVELYLVKEGEPLPASTDYQTKDDERKFWGKWATPGLIQGDVKENWLFLQKGDEWTAEVEYSDKSGKVVGKGVGKDVKREKDQLTFVLNYTEAPPKGNMDGQPVTVEWLTKFNELQAKCQKLGRSWRLQRRPLDPKALVGTWEGLAREVGLVEVWTVGVEGNHWALTGRWLKDGKDVGAFHGQFLSLSNSPLAFSIKVDKLPYEGFDQDKVMYSGGHADGDVLTYVYTTGPGATRDYGRDRRSAMVRIRPDKYPFVPKPMEKPGYENVTVLKQVAPGQYIIKAGDTEAKVQLEANTDAYDPAGKKIINVFGAMRPGNVVSLKVQKRPKAEFESILEVRMVKEGAGDGPVAGVALKEVGVIAESGVAAFFSPDAKWIAYKPDLLKLGLIQNTGAPGKPVFEGDYSSAVFTADGKFLVVADTQGKVQFISLSTGKPAGAGTPIPEKDKSGGVQNIAVSGNGKRTAVTRYLGSAVVFDSATGGNVTELEKCIAHRLVFSKDDKTLMGYDGNGDISTWDAGTGKRTGSWHVCQRDVVRCAFSEDGKLAVACEADTGIVRLWDMENAREVGQLKVMNFINAVALARDGKTFAVASSGNGKPEVQLVDVASQREKGGIKDLPTRVLGLSFAPDGKFLLVANEGSFDNKIKAATRLFSIK